MVKKKTYFMVGLFVIIGVLLGVSAIVWVSATQYFQKGSTFVTYFDESVQGLQVDSIVKYRGVDIGRVQKIRVAPDYKLIEVVMKIDFKGEVVRDFVANLSLAGITGIVFVELDTKKPENVKSPKITFRTEYPVILSRTSDIQQISSGVNNIVEKIRQVDFKGISDQIIHTTKAMETFLSGDRMKGILSSLESVANNLENITDKVNNIVKKGMVDDLLVEARDTIKEARAVITKTKEEINALHIAETTGKADKFIEDTTKKVQGVVTEIQVTSENLRRVSETLENLLERLNADPSLLIFSDPPPQTRPK
jgi:phospholipid/cholesterol/gamma-HCH transport system substrate-binding protein